MAAVNLLILADLIAPFIPLGLCGSLSVVAGGLSLLFPSCWRRPLPNTVEEAENKALIPIKDRYPSFRDLNRTGMKLASLASANSPAPSNLYSSHPPTSTKGPDQMTHHMHRPLHQSHSSDDGHHSHYHHHHHHYSEANGHPSLGGGGGGGGGSDGQIAYAGHSSRYSHQDQVNGSDACNLHGKSPLVPF